MALPFPLLFSFRIRLLSVDFHIGISTTAELAIQKT